MNIEGLEYIDKIVNVDQSPLGRTPRSNPATYTGVFSDIRNVLLIFRKPKYEDINRGDFLLMLPEDDAKCVEETVIRLLR